MSGNTVASGSGPALAAHSKDASVPGQTPASEATGETKSPANTSPDKSQRTAERATSSLSKAAQQAGASISEKGSQVSQFVQAQPLMALAVTGLAGLAIGMLISRR